MFSCSKEAAEKQNISLAQKQDDKKVEERILTFKKDVKVGSNVKSGEVVNVQDAVWLVEALVNYSFCRITPEKLNAKPDGIIVDSMFIPVSLTNNAVLYNDAIAAYLALQQTITEKFASLNYSTKFYDIVDVEFVDGQFRVVYSFVYKNLQTKSTETVTKSWYWGQDLGTCDGQNSGKDATDVIYEQISPTIPRNDAYTYFTNISWYGHEPWRDTCNCQNPFGYDNYLMFSTLVAPPPNPPAYPTIYFCLTAEQINYYAPRTRQAVLHALSRVNDHIMGRTVISWELQGMTLWTNGIPSPILLIHRVKVFCGFGHRDNPN